MGGSAESHGILKILYFKRDNRAYLRFVFNCIKYLLNLIEENDAVSEYINDLPPLNRSHPKFITWIYEFLSEALRGPQPVMTAPYMIRQDSAMETFRKFAQVMHDPTPIAPPETKSMVTLQIMEVPSDGPKKPSRIIFQVLKLHT